MKKDYLKTKEMGRKSYFTLLACFMIMSFMAVNVAAVFDIEHESIHEMNKDDFIAKNLQQFTVDMKNRVIHEKFELFINYNIEEINRDGQLFRRLSILNGGIDCGEFGEERPFLQYSLAIPGKIESIIVKFKNPTYVHATPTPYLAPQVLDSKTEILSPFWTGSFENKVKADWTLNHLSRTTVNNIRGELYSLKIYPVEFNDGVFSSIFNNVKVAYHAKGNQPNSSNPDPGHKPTGPVKYLIITHPDLIETVKPFAAWKSQKGHFTEIITTNELNKMYNTGDLPLKMRKYVQNMENKYDLDYLLIIGDWDKVPTRNTKNSYSNPMMGEPDNFASDLYFACVDSSTTWNKDSDFDYAEDGEVDDCIPDMANGRLAINSPTILSSVLNELMIRERNPTWDPKSEEAIYSCGDPGYMPGDPTDVMDYFWETYGKDVFTGNETIYYDESGTLSFTSESFKKVMNKNHQAMCYFGHGQPDGFPELFNNNDIARLKNNGTDGTFFAMACLTGWFDDPSNGTMMGALENCFGEMLTETPGKGLVGYISSSRMAVGAIDTIYSDDAPGLEEDYWRAIRKAAEGNLTPTVGSVWRDTVTSFGSSFFPFKTQGFDNPGLRTFLEYNLLGDPDAPLFLRRSEVLNLQYTLLSGKSSIKAKVTNSTGAPVKDVMVCIYRSSELGRSGYTNSDGEVIIRIPPNNGGVINITASKPGDIPVNYTFKLSDNLKPKSEYTIDPKDPDGNNYYYKILPTVNMFGDEPVDVEYRLDDGESVYVKNKASVVIPDGNHTIYFRVIDNSGHWSDWAAFDIFVDQTPPELSITTNPGSPDGDSGWYITMPRVVLNSNEILNSSYYSLDNGDDKTYMKPIQVTEGVHEIIFKAYDLAGNVNTTSVLIKVDLTAPKSIVNLSHQPDGENDYYITPPNIKLFCPEEFNAKLEYHWGSNNWKIYKKPFAPTEGEYTLYFRSTDVAGNIEATNNLIFKLDTEAPDLVINNNPSEPDGKNGFYTTNPKIEMKSVDGEVYYCLVEAEKSDNFVWSNDTGKPYQHSITIPEGNWALFVKTMDLAGNVYESEPIYYKVDTTKPKLNWELNPANPTGEHGWYLKSPVIELNSDTEEVALFWTFNNTDDWKSFNDEITLPSGTNKLKFKAIDEAGNEFYSETDCIKVDSEPPLVTITKPQAGLKTSPSITVEWEGEDSVSTIYKYQVRLDNKMWIDLDDDNIIEFEDLSNGKHTVYVRAWDFAGNSIKENRAFTVDATAPTVVSYTPRGKNVHIDSKITIKFSEEMRKDSVKIHVEGLLGTISWSNNTAVLTLDQELEYSTKYQIKVTAEDIYENSLDDYTWTFETESAPPNQEELESNLISTITLFASGITILVVLVIIVIFLRKKNLKKN